MVHRPAGGPDGMSCITNYLIGSTVRSIRVIFAGSGTIHKTMLMEKFRDGMQVF